MTANAGRSRAGPRATTIPNSACRPRIWFIKAVRWRISSDRTRCSASMSCCATLLTATNRIDDRPTASQIASASRASFLIRLHIWAYKARTHQPDLVSALGNLAGPVVCPSHASIPTRHGRSCATNGTSCRRRSSRSTTVRPCASTPWTRNRFFAKSIPNVLGPRRPDWNLRAGSIPSVPLL